MINRKCLFCNKNFKTYNSNIKKGGGKYCCQTCFGKHMRIRKAVFIKCASCGKTFKTTKSRIKNAKTNYCSYKCLGKRDKTGKNNPKWRGGKIEMSGGRVAVYKPEHPGAVLFGGTHILEYRLIAEKITGRQLKPNEIVHHKDGNIKNNALNNLEVMTQSEHAKKHMKQDPATGRFIK